MQYREIVADFAQRTLDNLNLVQREARAGNPRAYEVTQLWNSLLGLIIAPHELGVFPDIPLATLHAQGWPDITTGGSQPDTLKDVVHRMRNAVAHFNVEFQVDEHRQIHSVRVWNVPPNQQHRPRSKQQHTWDGCLDLQQLEVFATRIAAILVAARTPQAA
jgi:hypothetical protein